MKFPGELAVEVIKKIKAPLVNIIRYFQSLFKINSNFKDEAEQIDYYYSRSYKYREAQAFMRMTSKESLKVSSESGGNVSKLGVRLVSQTQDNSWPLQTWGVLGMSPRGSFFRYLMELYDESATVSVALKHTVKDRKASSDDLEFSMSAYLNPSPEKHYKNEDVVGTFLLDPESNSWYLNGSISLPDTEFKYDDKKLCLDSYTNDWFGVVEGNIWCGRIRKLVCKDKDVKNCKEKDANMENAPKIKLNIGGNDLSILPEDYIYFDKEGLQCRIGDPCSAIDQETCPQETEVVLGKLFLEKYIPIFSANRVNDERTITLVKYFKAPKDRKAIWIILGIIVVIVAVIGVIYVITKRKQASDESHYVKV